MRQNIVASTITRCLYGLAKMAVCKTLYWQLLWFVIVNIVAQELNAQEQTLKYQVIRNNEVIGHLNVHQNTLGQSTYISVESEVEARFIFLLIISAREETIYNNGVLIFSSMYRKLNGKEKTNIQVKLDGRSYRLKNKGKEMRTVSYPISFNLLNMYATEPKMISKAYADYFGEWATIEKIGANKYKVLLPDGNYNYYYYQNGICTRVEVHQNLYSLQFILVAKV